MKMQVFCVLEKEPLKAMNPHHPITPLVCAIDIEISYMCSHMQMGLLLSTTLRTSLSLDIAVF